MGKHPLSESAWSRGWQDTKTAWTSWQFYVLDAVAAVVIGGLFGWYWGLLVVVFGMICVWMAATISAPVKQRNELRAFCNETKANISYKQREIAGSYC